MSDNPLLKAWDEDQRRRSGKPSGNPLLDAWNSQSAPVPERAEQGMLDKVMEKVGDVGDYLAESMGLNFASDSWQEERARTGRGALDASANEGFFDKAGSLLERGGASANAGMATTVGAVTGSPRIQQRAKTLQPQANLDIAGNTTWEDLKANPGLGTLGGFVADTTVESLPLMAAAAAPFVGIPAVGASQTGNIAQARATANGQEDPTLRDVLLSAPFGVGSAFLERTGLMGILEAPGKSAVTRIAQAAGKEGITEAGQSGLEYTGGSVGTEQGFDPYQFADQVAAGTIGGVGMGGTIRGGVEAGAGSGRAVQSRVTGRPIPRGVREQAQAVPVTEGDAASPLPTDLIAQGKAVTADAGASSAASGILTRVGLPGVGERVTVRYPDGRTQSGVVADAFADPDFDGEPGVKINLDGGGTLDEHVSTLADAGVTVSRMSVEDMAAAADAIDASLAAQAPAAPEGVTEPVIPVAPTGQQTQQRDWKVADDGKIAPVSDAKALTEKLFPGIRVTSSKRAAGAAGKAGSKSWHVKSGAAVDVPPVKGMTFDQFVQRYREAGYSIIEAIDETDPATMKKTGATGPHWHVVLGTGGTPAAGGGAVGGGARIDVGDPFANDDAKPDGFAASRVDAVKLAAPMDEGAPATEWRNFAPETGTLGIPRAQMPQIAAENRGAMVNFLNARGVSHTEQTVSARSLKPTQAEFSTEKVAKARDFTGGDRAILVSSDDHVIDGHHQWIPKVEEGAEVRVIRLGATASELLDTMQEFPSATTDEGAGQAKQDAQGGETAHIDVPTAPPVPQSASPTWSIADTKDGKSVAIAGLSDKQIAAVTQAVPQAKGLRRADGARVYPKRHEGAIRDALAAAEETPAPTPLEAWADEARREEATQAGEADNAVPDAMDILAVVDAGNQTRNSGRSARERAAFRAGAAQELGERWREGGDPAALIEEFPDAAARGAKAAKQEFKRRQKAADAAPAAENAAADRNPPATTETGENPPENGADQPTDSAAPAFDAVWKSKEFKAAMKPLRDMPHRESHVAHDLVTGWTDGQARNAAALEQRYLADIADRQGAFQPNGFNPRQSYFEGFYAAVMGEAVEVRAIGDDTDRRISAATAWARIDAKLNPGADGEPQPPTAQPSPAAPDAERIDDFGEELQGARKHYAAAYKDRMATAADVDIAAEPLSKSWPEPDYQKLLDNGADSYVVAAVRAMRDEVPTKPQKGWKLKGWVDTVSTLRDYANTLLDGTDAPDVMQRFLADPGASRVTRDLQGRIDLYLAIGHGKSLRGVTLQYHAYTFYNGEKHDPPIQMWTVEQRAKKTAYSNWPRELAAAPTKDGAIAAFKARIDQVGDAPTVKQVKFDIYSRRTTPGFIIGKKIGKTYVDLKTFETAKEARAYLAENRADLIKMLEAYKDVPDVRRASNSPRVGENHRDGADVTPQQFADTFGFRGVQFGNYVEDARRREDLNEAFDALMDMAGVLDVPPKALSLNGELGLAFGARGKGGKNAAMAHYEPGNVVINLTKRAGAGSLAHEWWHALDNYFSRSGGRADSYMTGGSSAPIRDAMAEAFRGVNTAIRQTAVKQRSNQLDQRRSKPYWATDIEMSARSFESYIIAKLADNQFSNDYLANVVSETAFGIEGGYPYPTAAEIPAIRAGFDALFQTVETNESDGRVALQSRLEDRDPVATLTGNELGVDYRDADDLPALRTAAIDWYKRNLVGREVTMSDGVPVSFSARGLRKSTSLKGDILLRIVPAIRDILEKGDITWSGPGDRPDISQRIEVAGRVELGDDTYNLYVIVREHSDTKRRQYDLTFDNGYRDLSEGAEGRSSLIEGAASRGTLGDPETKSPSAELNLRLVQEKSNVAPDSDVVAARADLAQRLADYGLADRVALSLGNAILPPRVAGEFVAEPGIGRFITVALDTSPDARATLDHEVVHAARNMDLFMPAEWRSLEAAARGDRAMMGSVRKRYPNLTEEQQVEEAIADRFARWQGGDKERGFIARAFERLRDTLRAVGEALRGNGFTTADGVMRALAGGEVGARGDGTPVGAPDAAAEPATQRYSIVDDKVAEKRTSAARSALTRLAGKGSPFAGKTAEAFDRWRTAVQDRYLPLLRTQQRVEQQLGRPLTAEENPYLGEELLTGRVGAKLENLADNMVEPLFDQMQRDGVSIEELESYLYARHAPERNARIAKINPEFANGGGSGMSDIEAMAIINRIEKAGKTDAVKRVAALVDGIRDYALNERIEAGLMSADEAKAWRETYENYVPLRGKGDAGTEGDTDGIRINRSSGINVKGKESRAAFGRRSMADDILAYTLLQAEEAIVRAETNNVAQRFVELARAAPDAKFWQVDKVTRKPVMNQTTGIVRYEDQSRIQPEDAPFTVSAKFDGEEHRVTMNRDNASARRLADSMRNLTQQQLDWVTQHLGKINRFLSAVNTSWNPEFVITNAFRDLQAATINMAGIDVDGLVKNTLKDYPAALAGSMRGAFKVDKGDWGKWYREFTAEGGRVYFNNIEDLGGLKGRIEKEFAMSAARQRGAKMDMLTAQRGFAAVRDFVEAANSGVENAVRLAAYKNAREAGATKEQAASIAKNLTVNFNRRGQMGPAINAAYLFFNASMQGTARIFTAMKSPRVRKLLAGVVVGGFLIELLNAFMSGTDDDGESYYDKISDFDKSRNIIIMMPGGAGEHIKIPMPYGYNVFANAGRTIAEVARRGGDRWQESGANFLSSVADAFNPIGGTDSILKLIAPTVIDPIVDLEQNSDYSGRPIMPEQNPFEPDTPDAQRYFGSVAPHWKAVTDFFTRVTGGNDVEPGAIDVSPETLEHLSGVVFGAAGGFLDRNVGLATKLATGEEVEANDFPLVRKVYGEKPSWYDKSAFYDRINQVETAVEYAKGHIEREDWDRFDTFVDKNAEILSLEGSVKAANKQMREIRKARRENDFAREMGTIDDATWADTNQVVKDAEKLVVGDFNTVWNGVMLPQRDKAAPAR